MHLPWRVYCAWAVGIVRRRDGNDSSSNSTKKTGIWSNHRNPAGGKEGKSPAFNRTLPSAWAHDTLQGKCICQKNTPPKKQITRGTRVWRAKKILLSRQENTDFMLNLGSELTHFCRMKSIVLDLPLQKCVSSDPKFSIKSVFSFRDISIFLAHHTLVPLVICFL